MRGGQALSAVSPDGESLHLRAAVGSVAQAYEAAHICGDAQMGARVVWSDLNATSLKWKTKGRR